MLYITIKNIVLINKNYVLKPVQQQKNFMLTKLLLKVKNKVQLTTYVFFPTFISQKINFNFSKITVKAQYVNYKFANECLIIQNTNFYAFEHIL